VGRLNRLPLALDVPQALEAPLAALWRDGFVRLAPIFSAPEIAGFRAEGERLMRDIRPWAERHARYRQTEYLLPPFGDDDWAVLMNLAGRSGTVDELLERLFTHPRIKGMLEAIAGPGYKAWEISLRRANARDGGLRLHEDARGELGVAMLLADQPAVGATVFLRGSHRLPVSCREAGAEFIPPKYLSRLTQPATGSAGEIFVFFKKTWHGRIAGLSPTPSDALLLAVFPVGYEYLPFQPDQDLLRTMGTETARLLDPARQLRPSRDGRCVVTDLDGSTRYQGPPRLIDHLYRPRPRLHPLRAAALVGGSLRLVQAMTKRRRASAAR